MDILWQELSFGFADSQQFARVMIRLIAATVLGAAIGYERERAGKAAGLRTHILVALGTTVVVLAGSGYGMTSEGLSRVIQGIVTGIGFIGAGTILKLDEERSIRGLTSSAGIWSACAIGIAVALGELGLAIISTVLAVIILALVKVLEPKAADEESA